MNAAAPVLTLEDVTVSYDRIPAVHHVSGQIAQGALIALAGANGSGKSTLMKAMAGLIRPQAGRVIRHVPRDAIAYLPQLAELDRSFPITVEDMVALGLWRQAGVLGAAGRDCDARIEAALDAVGLDGFEHRPVGALSAGQLQRALFARLMLQDADVILLDEPFAAVDTRTTDDLMQVILRWHGEGRTIVAVLHDPAQIAAHFPETILMARELIAWGPTPAVMNASNLAAAQAVLGRWAQAVEASAHAGRHAAPARRP